MPPPNPDHLQWFAEEVQPCEPTLRAYLRRRFPTLGEVDDVVQESYLKLLHQRTAGNFRFARGMLFTVARNLALDIFRRRRRAPFVADPGDAARQVAAEVPGIVEAVCLDQELALLAEAMATLPPRCREVLTLRKFHGLSHREIAVRLGLSERRVNHELGTGIRRCADYLQARGVAVAAREPAA